MKVEEKSTTVLQFEEQIKLQEKEIEKCNFDIANFIKDIPLLKRENRNNYLFEKEYELGKKSLIHKNNYGLQKKLDYFEEGILFKDIHHEINYNKNKIKLLRVKKGIL